MRDFPLYTLFDCQRVISLILSGHAVTAEPFIDTGNSRFWQDLHSRSPSPDLLTEPLFFASFSRKRVETTHFQTQTLFFASFGRKAVKKTFSRWKVVFPKVRPQSRENEELGDSSSWRPTKQEYTNPTKMGIADERIRDVHKVLLGVEPCSQRIYTWVWWLVTNSPLTLSESSSHAYSGYSYVVVWVGGLGWWFGSLFCFVWILQCVWLESDFSKARVSSVDFA